MYAVQRITRWLLHREQKFLFYSVDFYFACLRKLLKFIYFQLKLAVVVFLKFALTLSETSLIDHKLYWRPQYLVKRCRNDEAAQLLFNTNWTALNLFTKSFWSCFFIEYAIIVLLYRCLVCFAADIEAIQSFCPNNQQCGDASCTAHLHPTVY